jgi:hypothetical protein
LPPQTSMTAMIDQMKRMTGLFALALSKGFWVMGVG